MLRFPNRAFHYVSTSSMTLHLEELETRVTQLSAICVHLQRQNRLLKEALVDKKKTEGRLRTYYLDR